MRRRTAVAVALAALAVAAPASAHQGNPNFLSQVGAIEPSGDGISVEILNRDDALLLHNTPARTSSSSATRTSPTRGSSPTAPSR